MDGVDVFCDNITNNYVLIIRLLSTSYPFASTLSN